MVERRSLALVRPVIDGERQQEEEQRDAERLAPAAYERCEVERDEQAVERNGIVRAGIRAGPRRVVRLRCRVALMRRTARAGSER